MRWHGDAPCSVLSHRPSLRSQERRKRRGGPLRLAGLCLPPKALGPLVPLYLQVRGVVGSTFVCWYVAGAHTRADRGSNLIPSPFFSKQGALAGGTPEVREAAVEALGELVDLTSEEALKPFVVAITGPLIRIVGDRFPSSIKAAILVTLGRLIAKAGPGLKPFVPQLQTTFLKCLADAADPVRTAAAANLGQLTTLSARVDQLTADLAASAASAPEPDTRVAYLQALRGALAASGPRLTPATMAKVEEALGTAFAAGGAAPTGPGAGETARAAAAAAIGAFAGATGADGARRVLALATGPLGAGGPGAREAGAMALAAICRDGAAQLAEGGLVADAGTAAITYAREQHHECRVAAGRAAARLAAHDASSGGGGPGGSPFGPVMQALLGPDQGAEVQRQALVALRRLARTAGAPALSPHMGVLLPCVTALLQRDPNSQLRAAGEAALRHALGLGGGDGGGALEGAQAAAVAVGGTARAFLTDSYLRRLAKLAEDEWEDREDY